MRSASDPPRPVRVDAPSVTGWMSRAHWYAVHEAALARRGAHAARHLRALAGLPAAEPVRPRRPPRR